MGATGDRVVCDLVLPCRDEAPALAALLARGPCRLPGDRGRQRLARRHRGRRAPPRRDRGGRGPTPGYGAAVHAGLLAATADLVAFMDGDGSFDPAELLPMVDDVRSGRADIAVGRRRPTGRGTWPWHARAGNALIVAWLRRRIALPAHDIAPMRVCRRADLLALGVDDRRFGYPVELLQKATRAGLAVRRARRRLPTARRGHQVEGVRLGARARAHRARLRAGPVVTSVAGRGQGARAGPGEDPPGRGHRHGGRRRRGRRLAARHPGGLRLGRLGLPPLAGR